MIEFQSQSGYQLDQQEDIVRWLSDLIKEHEYSEGDIQYVFCDDEYLLELNQEFLQHNTLTDIITFDYSLGRELHAEIYISTERVKDNAAKFSVEFTEELHRVMAHGLLHCMGHKDKSQEESEEMRSAENKALLRRNFR